MSHFSVNTVRPIAIYIVGVVALCLFGWAVSQEIIVISHGIDSQYNRQIAMGMFALAAIFGITALLKNGQRSEKPWAVSRAQVNRYYALFVVVTFFAVLIAK